MDDKSWPIDIEGECANCGVEFHIHKPPSTEELDQAKAYFRWKFSQGMSEEDRDIRAGESDYVYRQYGHGGSRIFIDGSPGERKLLVDTYHDEAFAKAINKFVRAYFYFQPETPE